MVAAIVDLVLKNSIGTEKRGGRRWESAEVMGGRGATRGHLETMAAGPGLRQGGKLRNQVKITSYLLK